MKFLRGLYMILATIVLLPLILLFEIIYFIYVLCVCIHFDETQRAFEIWYKYLVAGIRMNLDFINNGL